MKDIFKGYFKLSISSSLIFMLMGLLLYFNPEQIVKSVSILLGLFSFIFGISEIVIFLKNKELGQNNFVLGLFAIIIGLLFVINTDIIATIVPIIIGICMVFIGARKLSVSLILKEQNIRGWSYMFIIGIITLIIAAIFIINPIKGAFIATKMLGLIIIIYSVIGIIDSVIFKNMINEIGKVFQIK